MSAQSWSRRHHLLEPTSSIPIFKGWYLQGCIYSKAQRGLRTILIQKSKLKYAYLPSNIVAVWIDRFCVRYDWWRLLQPTSSVSLVWLLSNAKSVPNRYITTFKIPAAILTNESPVSHFRHLVPHPVTQVTGVGVVTRKVTFTERRHLLHVTVILPAFKNIWQI